MNSIFNLTLEMLENDLVENGFKKFNASQIYDWIYKKNEYNFDNFSNISKDLRNFLKNNYSISFPKVIERQVSYDKTIKYLFEFDDLSKVEGVLMHHDYGNSFCVSSEVGCNMGCAFCASGLKKKIRNLEAFEMVSMIIKSMDTEKERISSVVIMGTGEPLDNFDEVIRFIKIINAPKGLEIGIRHITLSTSGLVPKIIELSNLNLGINLAISLHAPTDDLRCKIMPINKAYPLKELIDACKVYFEKTKRRITFEYLLLKDVNDSRLYADKLADLIKHLNAYVNLIPYNKVSEFDFETSPEKNVNNFYDELKKRGINVTLRRKMGDDIDAACGQLRSKYTK